MSNYILQIDTATEICSVSISAEGVLIGEYAVREVNVHASMLTVYIDRLLKELSLDYKDLSAVAVSKGPGSYTGLRIGVSTAKGLCYALDIPLLGINTLGSMFEGYATHFGLADDSLYVPMLDARRMEVYMAIFDSSRNCVKDTAAVIVDLDTFDAFPQKKIVLFGSGANKLGELLSDRKHIMIDDQYRHSSTYLSKIAFQRLQRKEIEDLVYFEPFYLKEFVATVSKKLI